MRHIIYLILVLFCMTAAIPASAGEGQDTRVTRISNDSKGGQANGASSQPAISADGRFVAFTSTSSILEAGAPTGACQILVHDRFNGKTALVSINSAGDVANGNCLHPSISDDGRFVAFASFGDNLTANDANGSCDIFVHDRQTGDTSRVSIDSSGNEGDDHSSLPVLSADGRFAAFSSDAANLVPNDANGRRDIFVHDRHSGETELISINSGGQPGNSHSYAPSISQDGRFVAFYSHADNLVPDDTNRVTDVFVFDRQNRKTQRVSVHSNGEEGRGYSLEPGISGDGQYIVFSSFAPNLVENDGNGLRDVFLHDRLSGKTYRVPPNPGDIGPNLRTFHPKISADGRFVTFICGRSQLYVHDRAANWTGPLTKRTTNDAGSWVMSDAAISAEGDIVVFSSSSPALPGDDSGAHRDIFAVSLRSGEPESSCRRTCE